MTVDHRQQHLDSARATLSVVVLIRGIKMLMGEQKPRNEPAPPIVTPLAVYSVLLSFVYVAAMYFDILGYRIASIIYVTLFGFFLNHFKFKGLIVSFILSLIVTLGTHYIFTKILVISLP